MKFFSTDLRILPVTIAIVATLLACFFHARMLHDGSTATIQLRGGEFVRVVWVRGEWLEVARYTPPVATTN